MLNVQAMVMLVLWIQPGTAVDLCSADMKLAAEHMPVIPPASVSDDQPVLPPFEGIVTGYRSAQRTRPFWVWGGVIRSGNKSRGFGVAIAAPGL